MVVLTTTQKKVLDIYHNEGHVKAWNYWKLMGNTYGIFLGEVSSNEFIDGKLLPSSGEDICVTCGHRRIYDKAYLDSVIEKVNYYSRINGKWNIVDTYDDLTW